MRVFEIMTKQVLTVRASLSAPEAWELMRAKGIHHLVVVNGRIVVGVLSHRDAGGRAGAAVREGKTVGDLMSRGVVTAKKTDTVRRAANLMRGHSVGCLPIVEGSKLVGIITTADLLDVVGGAADRPATKTRRGLSHRVPHRKQHTPSGVW